MRPINNMIFKLAANLMIISIAGCQGDLIEIDGSSSVSTLTDPELSWSASSYEATIGAENSFPALTNTHKVDVTYTSSDASVASIASDGTITLIGAGSTTITATAAANDTYKSASASYSLVVTSTADDGAGSYTFPSTGDASSDDDISNTKFTSKITVTYSSSGASVTGDHYGYVNVSGNNVTVNNTGDEYIVYELTGSTSVSLSSYSGGGGQGGPGGGGGPGGRW